MFNRLDDLRAFIGFSGFPPKMESLWADFNSDADHSWMNRSDLERTIDLAKLHDIDTSALLKATEWFESHPRHRFCLAFLRYAIMTGAHPSHWLVKHGPRWTDSAPSDPLTELLLVLSLVLPSKTDHERRGIDPSFAAFNLNHLKNYIRNFREKHGTLGIEPFGWTTYLATLGLLPIGSLQFMHHVFTDPYVVYRHSLTKEICVVAKPNLSINSWGQFKGVNQRNDVSFETAFAEDADYVFAHRVNPRGIISPQTLCLPKSEWEPLIRQGTPVIDFHIPTKTRYDIESMRDTFLKAIEFFTKHYPEFRYEAFWCVSWLYSPQLPWMIRNPESRIMRIHEQGYLCPATPDEGSLFTFVFQKEHVDVQQVVPRTSLERSILEYYRQGGRVNAGLFLYFFQDMDKFGESPYLKPSDKTDFAAIRPFEETLYD